MTWVTGWLGETRAAAFQGRFGEVASGQERGELVDMLAALHESTAAAARASACKIGSAYFMPLAAWATGLQKGRS